MRNESMTFTYGVSRGQWLPNIGYDEADASISVYYMIMHGDNAPW